MVPGKKILKCFIIYGHGSHLGHVTSIILMKFHFLVPTSLRPCHTLPDSANGRVTDSKILCPFVSVRMRFLSVPRAVNAFRVR